MPPSPRLGEVLREYLELRRDNQKPTTYASDRMYLDRLLAHVGNIQMRHLQVSHFTGWLQAPAPLGVGGLSNGSYNNALQRLRGFDGYCRERGYYSKSLLPRQVKAKSDPAKHRARYDARTLLAIIEASDNPRDRIANAVFCNTAMRSGELLPIRWGHVDLDAGFIDMTSFKGGDKIDRRPITLELDAEIRRWKQYVTSEVGFPEDNWYFVCAKASFRWERTPEGDVRNNLGRLRPTVKWRHPHDAVQKSLAKLGLPTDKEGGHTLRRSVALIYFERLAEQGYDDALLTVSALLNHANVTVTQRYLGLDRHREKRDATLRGVAFLTEGETSATVTALPTVGSVTG